MQIHQIKICNFRGIRFLDWKPQSGFCCLIGPGDTGKSSILDAAEACLSSRWFVFSESDFTDCDTSKDILIEATIGELSRALTSDERFGLYIRGWKPEGILRDEPEEDDEAVLTVRLTVDATMEPVWQLVCDRASDPRVLSNRDRALFGLVRLAGDDARQLSWAQGSVLARLTGENDEAAERLAAAYKAARENAGLASIPSLAEAAGKAEGFAKELGAYVGEGYAPGLELGRSGLNAGSIALHDGQVPLRLAGLGTRRLATLGLQRSAIQEGAIVLIDEIEHGLEPHRILGAISRLKAVQAEDGASGKAIGQTLMTTHSEVALSEAGTKALRFVIKDHAEKQLEIRESIDLEAMRALIRFSPRALFARRIMVCEGNTEVGLLMGLKECWAAGRDNLPIEHKASAIGDGNGSEAPAMALNLKALGYHVAVFRDSDAPLREKDAEALQEAGIPVFEYGDGIYTELAIFAPADDSHVEELLNHARHEWHEGLINSHIAQKVDGISVKHLEESFTIWAKNSPLNPEELRSRLAEVASAKAFESKTKQGKGWFKDQNRSRGLAPIVEEIALLAPSSPLAQTLWAVECWLYE